jgi:hypothetical protein
MPVRDSEIVRVGDVFIAPTFVVSPTDVAEHRVQCLMSSGRMEEVRAFRGMSSAAATSFVSRRACPTALLVRRAAESILGALPRRLQTSVRLRDVGRVRRVATPVVGESITPVATVRFRSQRNGEGTHVTLDVGVRRRNGSLLARFELGVEFGGPAGRAGASLDDFDCDQDAA